MTIGEKIKFLRQKKGLTQKQLGALCGMADSAIRKDMKADGGKTENSNIK